MWLLSEKTDDEGWKALLALFGNVEKTSAELVEVDYSKTPGVAVSVQAKVAGTSYSDENEEGWDHRPVPDRQERMDIRKDLTRWFQSLVRWPLAVPPGRV